MTSSFVLWAGVALLVLLAAIAGRRKPRRPSVPWGEWPDRARDFAWIGQYFRARAAASTARTLDDRTWSDLNMDDVFRLLDRTESLLGQQALYARLRAAPTADHLEAFEALVTRFETDAAVRETARVALGRMSRVDGQDLLWLTEPGAVAVARWHVVFPIVGLTLLVSIAITPFHPVALLAVGAGALVNLALRGRAARALVAAAGAFRQVGPLLAAAAALRPIDTTETTAITAPIREDLPTLSRLRRIASWAGRDPIGSASGDIGAIALEYLNLLCSLDGNALFFGARELGARGAELGRVTHAVGEIDAARAVASFRAGTKGWTRPVFRPAGAQAVLTGLRHPLLPDAVANAVHLAPPHGLIITGSNMSGKTTFLRTLGVTAILAQTIHTCVCDGYEAPRFVVRTCIGRADDPATGKSYYLVEVESVLALLRAAEGAEPHLMLFDELFRGTNTVERIAAGEAVLASFLDRSSDAARRPHVIVVATHDQELVDLLDGLYAPFHFEGTVDAEGLTFDYRLREGSTRGRNAIALLEQRGAPAALVAHARTRAAALDATRETRRRGDQT